MGSLFGFLFEKATAKAPIPLSSIVRRLRQTRNSDGTWTLSGLNDDQRNLLGRVFEISKPSEVLDKRLW
jgi:hypothetical protein